MTLPELIKEYKDQAIISSKINYSDDKSVNANNIAVKRMYEITNVIKSKFGIEGVTEFSNLLNIKDYDINIWSAVQLVEKLNPSKELKEKALKIIKEAAKSNDVRGIGFQRWLKDYEM